MRSVALSSSTALDLDVPHHDVARLAIDFRALARQLIEPTAPVVDRGVHRRDLTDAADERAARGVEPCVREAGHRRPREHPPGEVMRVGRDAEAHGGHVLLVLIHQVGRKLRGLADEQG